MVKRKIEGAIRSRNWTIGLFLFGFCLMLTAAGLQLFITGYQLGSKGVYFDTNYFALAEEDKSNIENCENLELVETAECLNRYVRSIFNYNVREDTIKSFDDIVENGGDCYDYSNLYVSMAKSLGYRGSVTAFSLNESTGHAFAIISDDNSYCVLDQRVSPTCYGLG